MALGWHYAIDGIVGAAGAVACQWAAGAWFRSRTRPIMIAAEVAV